MSNPTPEGRGYWKRPATKTDVWIALCGIPIGLLIIGIGVILLFA